MVMVLSAFTVVAFACVLGAQASPVAQAASQSAATAASATVAATSSAFHWDMGIAYGVPDAPPPETTTLSKTTVVVDVVPTTTAVAANAVTTTTSAANVVPVTTVASQNAAVRLAESDPVVAQVDDSSNPVNQVSLPDQQVSLDEQLVPEHDAAAPVPPTQPGNAVQAPSMDIPSSNSNSNRNSNSNVVSNAKPFVSSTNNGTPIPPTKVQKIDVNVAAPPAPQQAAAQSGKDGNGIGLSAQALADKAAADATAHKSAAVSTVARAGIWAIVSATFISLFVY